MQIYGKVKTKTVSSALILASSSWELFTVTIILAKKGGILKGR